jgi:ATP-dependent RNA helicase DDX52/ROK1
LHQRDLLACAPTGSGKTLAFLIPLVQQIIESKKAHNNATAIRGLIISPTRELAQQIFEQCERVSSKTSIRPALLSKSLSAKLKNNNEQSVHLSKKKQFDILVTTPLRLIDLIQSLSKSGSATFFDLSKAEHLIFDEADKLFDSNFLKQSDEILSICTNPKLTKSMFSATIPSSVEEISNQLMLDPIRVIIGHKEAANSQILQELSYCGNEEGKLIAIRQLIQQGKFKPPVIIFLQSITRAKALYHELLYDKLKVDVIHSERTQVQRENIIENFRKGDIWVLICTDVLSRGIDFKGVNLVINYDVPNSAQAYVHRIGRTGRAGKEGHAVTFYTKEDSLAVKPIVNVMKQSGSELAAWLQKGLPKLTQRDRDSMKRSQVKRKGISTVPKIDKQKKRQRREMITASKKRKQIAEQESESDVEEST